MAEIQLRGVSMGWGDVLGVKNVNLEIRDKEFVVFLGPSGCGKTTTMRMIAGLNEPTAGEILIDGEVVNDRDPRDRDVAMVFQSYALYPTMSIYENIRFPLRMRGVPKADQDALVRRAAAMVELGDYLDRKPKALSGGQRQRAALARAIVRQPRVFLMDEPLSNLDAKLRHTMRAQLKHIQRELATTTVYVTHDQIEAMTLADRIVVMSKGEIQQIGTPDEIYNDPKTTFVAGFIGSPPMNLLDADLQDGAAVAAGLKTRPLFQGTRTGVVLGVRPEDLTVAPAGTGDIKGSLYAVEPTGDVTLILVDMGGQFVTAKVDRRFRQEMNTPVELKLPAERVYLFDRASGKRI
jgi:multiple sugar transport system ATP-binding protein